MDAALKELGRQQQRLQVRAEPRGHVRLAGSAVINLLQPVDMHLELQGRELRLELT